MKIQHKHNWGKLFKTLDKFIRSELIIVRNNICTNIVQDIMYQTRVQFLMASYMNLFERFKFKL